MLGEIVPRKGNVNLPKRAGIHFTRAKYRGCELTLDNAVILRPHARESNESSDTGRLGRRRSSRA